MTRALAFVALLGVGSCSFAQKHPAVTIGAVAGTLTLGLCSLNVSDKVDCLIAGGIASTPPILVSVRPFACMTL